MSKKKTTSSDRGNIYDRIFRENANHIFLPLIERQLGIEITSYEKVPSKIAKTVEREVDFLYKVKTKSGLEFLLHIEFQTKNEKGMIYRMKEYDSLFNRIYQLPTRHFVIFLGKGRSTMKTELEPEEVFTGFEVINLFKLDTYELLSSPIPEVVLLALLSEFKEEQTETILHSIYERLQELSTAIELEKYLNQLLLLSRIRNLESKTNKFISDMPVYYDVERDELYLQGIEKGLERGIERGMEKGLEKGLERGMEKGLEKGILMEQEKNKLKEDQAIVNLYQLGLTKENICSALEVTMERVEEVIKRLN